MPTDPPAPFHPTATRRVRNNVRVGVGVVVLAPSQGGSDSTNRIYAGVRKGSHGDGSLALPGGHLELYESWEDCARREIKEEMNVDVRDVQFLHVTNDPMPDENKHYVTIFMAARLADSQQVVTNMEPEKCEGWQAFSLDELKETTTMNDTDGSKATNITLFGPLKQLIQEEPQALQAFLA